MPGFAHSKLHCFLSQIRPFREAHLNRGTDKELKGLTKYLKKIADLKNFDELNHDRWEKYKREEKQTDS